MSEEQVALVVFAVNPNNAHLATIERWWVGDWETITERQHDLWDIGVPSGRFDLYNCDDCHTLRVIDPTDDLCGYMWMLLEKQCLNCGKVWE